MYQKVYKKLRRNQKITEGLKPNESKNEKRIKIKNINRESKYQEK